MALGAPRGHPGVVPEVGAPFWAQGPGSSVVSAPGGSGLANSAVPGSLRVSGESISSCSPSSGGSLSCPEPRGTPGAPARTPPHSPALAAALSAAAEGAPGNTPPGNPAPGKSPAAPAGTSGVSIAQKRLQERVLPSPWAQGPAWHCQGWREAASAGTALSCTPKFLLPPTSHPAQQHLAPPLPDPLQPLWLMSPRWGGCSASPAQAGPTQSALGRWGQGDKGCPVPRVVLWGHSPGGQRAVLTWLQAKGAESPESSDPWEEKRAEEGAARPGGTEEPRWHRGDGDTAQGRAQGQVTNVLAGTRVPSASAAPTLPGHRGTEPNVSG